MVLDYILPLITLSNTDAKGVAAEWQCINNYNKNMMDNSNIPKLTIRANPYVPTDVHNLIIEKLR